VIEQIFIDNFTPMLITYKKFKEGVMLLGYRSYGYLNIWRPHYIRSTKGQNYLLHLFTSNLKNMVKGNPIVFLVEDFDQKIMKL